MSAEIQFAHQDHGWEYKQACLSCGANTMSRYKHAATCASNTSRPTSAKSTLNRPASALSTTYSNKSISSKIKSGKSSGLIRKGSNFSNKSGNTSVVSLKGSLKGNSCEIFKIDKVKEDVGLGSLSSKRFINKCNQEFNMASPKSPD